MLSQSPKQTLRKKRHDVTHFYGVGGEACWDCMENSVLKFILYEHKHITFSVLDICGFLHLSISKAVDTKCLKHNDDS